MPTYAYACTACGHAFDVHQSFDDDALTVCPQCQGRLRRLITSVGVTFKGSGFYHNDSRSSSSSSRHATAKKEPAVSSDAKSATSDASTAKPSTPKASAAPAKSPANV